MPDRTACSSASDPADAPDAPATQTAPRALLPDLARAVALFGIAVVNVGLFAYPGATGYTLGALDSALDRALFFAVLALFAFKSYSLFAFSFGVGLGQQMRSAQARGQAFGARYTRRLLGLALLGAFNVYAFFHGDILLIYAALGALLFLFRNAPTQRLLRWGVVLYALQIGIIALAGVAVWLWATMAPQEMAADLALLPAELDRARAGFGASSFTEVAAHRARTWREDIGPALLVQGFGAMAFFLLGLAGWRSGVLDDPAHPFWQRCRRRWLPLGLVISATGAALMLGAEHLLDPQAVLGLGLVALSSPFASAGYLGLLAGWARGPDSALRRFMARAGSASLSAYLLQGLLLSLAFSGYGLGWYGHASAAWCIAAGAVVGLFSLLAAGLWRMRFARGPFEALLRAWTYLGRH
jgi:uncharacterized protein